MLQKSGRKKKQSALINSENENAIRRMEREFSILR